MLYYNMTAMTAHESHAAHHHHHPGHLHPPASVAPSILRMSLWQRLSFAAVLIALMWSAAFWAMQ